jgi:hypothetical protein
LAGHWDVEHGTAENVLGFGRPWVELIAVVTPCLEGAVVCLADDAVDDLARVTYGAATPERDDVAHSVLVRLPDEHQVTVLVRRLHALALDDDVRRRTA